MRRLRALGLSTMTLGYAMILCGFNPAYHLRNHNTMVAVIGLCVAGLGISFIERGGGDSKTRFLISLATFFTWSVVVGYGVVHHVFWRDEVRALTLSIEPRSIWSVPAAIHGEGHPALWYLLLAAAYKIAHTPLVLPLVSATVAAAAIVIFLARNTLPWWWTPFFVFSAGPVYEYSVMARNYGISMLLMFLFAVAYLGRKQSAILIGAILFLLAQTNVHSALLVPIFLGIWLWHWARDKSNKAYTVSTSSVTAGILLACAGILVAFLTVYPTHMTAVTDTATGKISIGSAVATAILNPGLHYGHMLHLPPRAITVILYLATLGLIVDLPLFLASIAGLWVHCVFFGLVYGAAHHHQLLWPTFLITLFWLRFSPTTRTSKDHAIRGYLPMLSKYAAALVPLIFAANSIYGFRAIDRDNRQPASESRDFAKFLSSSPSLRDAIVIPEPEFIGEAIPYYASNDIYLVREEKFGKIATWSRESRHDLRLSSFLEAAKNLKAKTGRPVVILMEFPPIPADVGKTIEVGFGWRISYTENELRDFTAATEKIASERESTLDENFDVYLVK